MKRERLEDILRKFRTLLTGGSSNQWPASPPGFSCSAIIDMARGKSAAYLLRELDQYERSKWLMSIISIGFRNNFNKSIINMRGVFLEMEKEKGDWLWTWVKK